MIDQLGQKARTAARRLAEATAAEKDAALVDAARRLQTNTASLIEANAGDLDQAAAEGISGALLDRLRLSDSRIEAMANGLRKVAALDDPIGEITAAWTLANGLQLTKVRAPLGVVAVIYEARPNVTADAAGLCIKSGNAAILRGSSYALRSNLAIGREISDGLEHAGLPTDAVQVMADTSREGAKELMQAKEWIDLLVPRGGPKLLAAIEEHATVPVVIDGAGNCHVYVDASADLAMAEEIVFNAKTSRPGVCNAAEKLLVHREVVEEFLPNIYKRLADAGVVVKGDGTAQRVVSEIQPADESDWPLEYLDLVMAVKVVDDVDEAIEHIRRYGSGHSEAVVAQDSEVAERFVAKTDSAVVLVNASTRFTDGEEFGFGGEIGISTQKLHVRGPMGLVALTSERYVVRGEGQVRV